MLHKIRWWVFGVLCVSIGLYPLIYFIVDRRFGLLSSKTQALLDDVLWNTGFYGHIVLGGMALAIGWVQFSKKMRRQKPKLHRTVGLLYVIAVIVSGICGIYIGLFATGGVISSVGFILLGIIWLVTTILAFDAARKKQFDQHENLMIYSYAACFAAVTLRLWLPVLTAALGEFIAAYRIVAWLCWVPNLLVAYWIVNQRKIKESR